MSASSTAPPTGAQFPAAADAGADTPSSGS